MYQTLIIGAGAAGLAAGRALHDAGHNILILEARDRIGGRAWTDHTFADFPVEFGAEFIHGEHAITHELVKQAGLHTIPVVRMDNLWWSENNLPAKPLPKSHRIGNLLSAYGLALKPNLSPQGIESLKENDYSLAKEFRARGWDGDDLEIADVLFAQTCCAKIDSLSMADLLREAYADHAGSLEFRIEEGYAALFDWYSSDLPIRLNMPVSEIQWSAQSVIVIANGESFQAQKCIITVPVPVLAKGTIRFDPSLSTEKQSAIAALRTEPATKLIYRFRQPLWNESLTFMAHTGVAARWWTPGYGRKVSDVIACYITAERANAIDQMPHGDALEMGFQELSTLLGLPLLNLRHELVTGKRVSWAQDSHALGGYAHVPPGHADARPTLAQPEGGMLFFAGEATAYDSNPQTVHGAIESGLRAARECAG